MNAPNEPTGPHSTTDPVQQPADSRVNRAQDRPFARAALRYRARGWLGTLPMPRGEKAKRYPPGGFTGWEGRWPDAEDIELWLATRGNANIALRLPRGVVGLDVDAYEDKQGGATLAKLEAECGPLPATWRSSARADDPISGIRLFRAELPEGRRWKNEAGPGIELVHFGHRYVMAAPSIHPARGVRYRWWRGEQRATVPAPDELPALPPEWIEALTVLVPPPDAKQVHEGPPKFTRGQQGTAYGLRALERELATLRKVWDGNTEAFNPVLNRVAFALGQLVGGGELDADHARGQLDALLSELGAPADQWRTLASGWESGLAQPRSAPNKEQETVSDDQDPADWVPGLDELIAKIEANTYDTDRLDELPEPRYLVKGVLDLRSVTRIVGPSGIGKSFLVLDLACHVALGLPWRDFRVRQGGVLYVAAEGRSGIRKRVRAWEQYYGKRATGVHVVAMPIKIATAQKYELPVISAEWKALTEVARRKRVSLIVVDTQARATAELDENDNSEMNVLVEACEYARDQTSACVLLVHHTGNGSADRARGASAVIGAMDTEIVLRWEKEGEQRKRAFTNPKQKEHRAQPDLFFDLKEVSLWRDEDGDMVSSAVAVALDPDAIDQVRKKSRENLPDWLQILANDGGWMTAQEWSPLTKLSESRIKRLAKEHAKVESRQRAGTTANEFRYNSEEAVSEGG